MVDLEWNADYFEQHQAEFEKLMSELKTMGHKYESTKKETIANKVNVFRLISKHYYYENCHSDIIKTFLDPSGMHYEGNRFLNLFIEFINKRLSKNNKQLVSVEDYRDAIVTREEGRIDILIKSKSSKHCIIIENKMNNAPDQEDQLPRYNIFMVNNGYVVDCIVYLPLNYKEPNTKDEEGIKDLLCIIPAVKLVDGWINPCVKAATDSDCASILKQYGELIITLSEEIMDNETLEKFSNHLRNNSDCIETAIFVGDMMNKIPIYMKNNIKTELDKLQDDFYKVYVWEPENKPSNHCGIMHEIVEEADLKRNVIQYKVDVISEIGKDKGKYQLQYRILVYRQLNNTDRFTDFTKSMSLKDFQLKDGRMELIITFGEEKRLIECVKRILEKMKSEIVKHTVNN